MEHSPLLFDLTILFGAALAVSYLFRAAHLSTLTGFIVAGALIGPSGFGWISSIEQVRQMEEIGVILLLFAIGIEFAPDRVPNMRRVALMGGGGQVLLTGAAIALVATLFSAAGATAVVLGMVGALSSTVIGLRMLDERRQTTSPEGRVSLAVLIFQDMAVLPMILLVPFLAGETPGSAVEVVRTLGFSALALVLILVMARGVIPRLIERVVHARSRDLFILSVIGVVAAIAWASTQFGISAGLGAFIAGWAISKSEYSHQVLSDVLPFRETFNSLFFVSVGMLLDPGFILGNFAVIAAVAFLIIVFKTSVTGGMVRLLGYPWRVALGVGLMLSQVGEFSIVLLQAGATDVLSPELGQIVLATILVTMAVTPLTIRVADWARPSGLTETGKDAVDLADHTLVVGYGLNGRNVASLLKAAGFPYAILEMNPHLVSEGKKAGLPIYYGDALSTSVLEWVGAGRARAIVFAISDPNATRGAVAAARRLNPTAWILARTRYIPEIEPLYAAGATIVITEDFETSLAIIRRLLSQLGVHASKIDQTVVQIRQQHYEPFLGAAPPVIEKGSEIRIFEATVRSASDGQSIEDLQVRAKSGATIVAVERAGAVQTNPPPEMVLREGDRLHLIGSEQEIGAAIPLF